MNRTGTGTTALMAACAGGHKSVVDLLLRHKDINVDVKDNAGKTALLLARQDGGHGKGIVTSLFLAMKSKPPGKISKQRSSNGAVGGKGI
jgi:ankyrin repeat protein